ncbi:MAG: hypothetical protein M5R40_28325 [Anaerolineae bacterium]|nr:hypothetical protein [Anaerolineae bacterium]
MRKSRTRQPAAEKRMSQHPTEDTPRLAALRHRDFRLLWAGETVSVIGAQMQLIAINWHVYALLKGDAVVLSVLGQDVALDAGALGLGVLGLVRVVPIVVFALVGGCSPTYATAAR